ncbi:hypothetical protein QLQ86_04955 [Halomonas sp. LR5S13]|uniref:hypothetical protein n=1 Tax=Halomonas rhizosphaerae TaxID=3043296 RepID=UPI0024A9CAD6|nr:hypothetical protein [Halomonas rhizosphaerae]MDI5920135.1 hypothetical protein [Halomonas rhizosphaerae]
MTSEFDGPPANGAGAASAETLAEVVPEPVSGPRPAAREHPGETLTALCPATLTGRDRF